MKEYLNWSGLSHYNTKIKKWVASKVIALALDDLDIRTSVQKLKINSLEKDVDFLKEQSKLAKEEEKVITEALNELNNVKADKEEIAKLWEAIAELQNLNA